MYDLRILVNGRPIKKYHDKDGNIWVEARKGAEFEIELKNDSWNKFLGIVSVDGLNVINAKHLPVSESNGYIVHSKNNIVIPGWKISKNKVKKFTFTTQGNSYSKKIGADESNIGVIAACFIEEAKPEMNWSKICDKSWHVPYTGEFVTYGFTQPYQSTLTSSIIKTVEYNTDTIMLNEKVAVGSGKKSEFKTHNVKFERGSELGTIKIYYDTRENLETKGIIKDETGIPQPFVEENHYCPDV